MLYTFFIKKKHANCFYTDLMELDHVDTMDKDQRIAEGHNNLREVARHGPVKIMMIEG